MSVDTQPNGHSEAGQSASKVNPGDVGWQFVPQYYNFVNKQPHRLHCFYNKRSTFTHGEEGEDITPAHGQQEIHERITAIGYDLCKVYIHSIDSQSSANGGIIILVLGEMSNRNGPWRKFTQTFFLAEQPNGYFVLNDIFRYLKEETGDDDDEETGAEYGHGHAQTAPAHAPAVSAPPQAPAPSAEPVSRVEHPQQLPTPPTDTVHLQPEVIDAPAAPAAPQAEPEPVQAPAHPDPTKVPVEAVVASVPDKDIAPSEPSQAQEQPITSAPAATEQSTSSAPPATAPGSTAPKAVEQNGTAAPVAPAPAPAKPAAPKSWAALAASNVPRSATQPTTSPAPPAPAPAPVQAAPRKEEPAPAATTSSASTQPRHPYYENAMRVQTAHCFVKLPNWSVENQSGGESMDENALKAAAQRFGEVTKVEIVKSKACAFVEFANVASARKAIVASLSPAQGGEGGVRVGDGKLNFETRKEKDERRPKGAAGGQGPQGSGQGGQGGRGGGMGGAGGQEGRGGMRGGGRTGGQGREQGEGQQSGGERAGPGAGPGRGRGRGRGGAMGGGAGAGEGRGAPIQK